jgi:hypothetical protein
MEFGEMPISVRVWPCKLAPREFITMSEGTICGLAELGAPIVFIAGAGDAAGAF